MKGGAKPQGEGLGGDGACVRQRANGAKKVTGIALERVDCSTVKQDEALRRPGARSGRRQAGKHLLIIAVLDHAKALTRDLRVAFAIQLAGARCRENRPGRAAHRGDLDLLVGAP